MCIVLSCTFLCRRCMTTTWKCLISHFVEDVNTWQQLSFSFPELWYSRLEFNYKTRWNKCNKDWGNANSLFKWHFCSRRHHCCLSSLFSNYTVNHQPRQARSSPGQAKCENCLHKGSAWNQAFFFEPCTCLYGLAIEDKMCSQVKPEFLLSPMQLTPVMFVS